MRMKKTYNLILASAAFLFSCLSANAITHTVQVADFSFTPSTITNVQIGDIVSFVWVSGTHTTTSASVPSGAATWNQNITSSSTTFNYTVTHAGTYAYFCAIHSTSMGGGFLVSGTGIGQTDLNVSSVMYPNPCKDKMTITYSGNIDGVTIYNMAGQEMRSMKFSNALDKAEVDMSTLPAGVYFCSTSKEGVVVETKRIVKTN